MTVRLWFRPEGQSDGLWWTLQMQGREVHASDVSICARSWTSYDLDNPDPVRRNRRHFIECDVSRVLWDGTIAVLDGVSGGT